MTEPKLTAFQSRFVVAVVDNELAGGKLPDWEIAVQAGYSRKTAAETASDLLRLPHVIAAIAHRKQELLTDEAPAIDAGRVIREWVNVALADRTGIVKVRRLNCRYCWGQSFLYQWTDAEYARESAQELDEPDPDLSRFDGGGGFRHTRDPHPHCPECDGEGVEDVYIADFRKLSDDQRQLIVGVKQGKHGIEVALRDPDPALRNIAQYLGLLIERKEHTGKNGGPIQTANVNYTLPTDPVDASRVYQAIMEGKG